MSMYSIDEIVQWELGKNGLCVIVEGETHADDPYFFNQWFGGRYPSITFYHQNGYTKVAEAVSGVRVKLPPNHVGKPRVYGITDRDFRNPYPVNVMPNDGVLRMSKCMLENYFLAPQPWSVYLWNIINRKVLRGELDLQVWGSQKAISQNFQSEIERIYRANLEVAAHNWTLFVIKQRFQDLNQDVPTGFPKDLDFPEQYDARKWADLAQLTGIEMAEIEKIFISRLNFLQSIETGELSSFVQGKALYHQFLLRYIRPQLKISGNEYDIAAEAMKHRAEPPQDLDNLIAFIEQYAFSS